MGGNSEYKNKWIAEKLDRINLTVPKGRKDLISSHAGETGESVNGFINRAIDEAISHDSSPGVSDGLVSAETLKTVQAHIVEEDLSETPETFIARAVNDTIARDRQLKRLGRDKQGKSMWQMPEVKAE